jgi:4-oxalomesaconate tautomerase
MQTSIRCLFMRGDTPRGPFSPQSDLPADTTICDHVLLAALGSLRHGNPK